MNTVQHNNHIDAKGMSCPVPLMLLKKAVEELQAGCAVQIEVTDVHAELDFEIWCERFGHQLEKLIENDGVINFLVIKGVPDN